MVANFFKLDKFEGVDFRRCQKKMHFLLSTMSVAYVLTTPMPEAGDNATVEQIRNKSKWENDDYVCRGIILNGVNIGNKANGSGIKGSMDGSSNSLKGARVHVCKDRCWFKTYESLNDVSILYIGNESTALYMDVV
nr:zinc finger, CCHC-type [Tanacetum cinerariifolium]